MRVTEFNPYSLAAYAAFIALVASLCLEVSRHVGSQAMGLVGTLVAPQDERPPTLVERRQLEAGDPIEPSQPEIVRLPSVLEMPAISAPVLAANLDKVERYDLVSPSARRHRASGRRDAARKAPQPRMAAADAFGRSFGVMLMASR